MATLVKRSAGWKKAKMRRESVESEAWSSRPLEAASNPREQLLTRRRTALTASMWRVGNGASERGSGMPVRTCMGVHRSPCFFVAMPPDSRLLVLIHSNYAHVLNAAGWIAKCSRVLLGRPPVSAWAGAGWMACGTSGTRNGRGRPDIQWKPTQWWSLAAIGRRVAVPGVCFGGSIFVGSSEVMGRGGHCASHAETRPGQTFK